MPLKVIAITQDDILEYLESKGHDVKNTSGSFHAYTSGGDDAKEVVVTYNYTKAES